MTTAAEHETVVEHESATFEGLKGTDSKKLGDAERSITETLRNRYKFLDLSGLSLTALPDLGREFSNLDSLMIHGNQLRSLPDMRHCSSLHYVDCHANPLRDISAAAGWKSLRMLVCADCELSSLPDLSACTQLASVACQGNPWDEAWLADFAKATGWERDGIVDGGAVKKWGAVLSRRRVKSSRHTSVSGDS